MAENTKIGWADDSVNLWWGCVEVSSEPRGGGCDNCYARELSKRFGHDVWGNDRPRRMLPSAFKLLDRCQARAVKEGRRRRVFVNSMSDLAETLPQSHPQSKAIDDARRGFFGNIVQGCYPSLDLIWLTKRIGNVPKVVPRDWMEGLWPKNLWLVPTIVNQHEADRDLPKLFAIPAKVRGVSVEPLLGPVDLSRITDALRQYRDAPCGMGSLAYRGALHWVIVGGESGPNRRPMELEWMGSLVKQCHDAGVPCFVKQDAALRDGQQGRIPDEWWAVKQFPSPCSLPKQPQGEG